MNKRKRRDSTNKMRMDNKTYRMLRKNRWLNNTNSDGRTEIANGIKSSYIIS